MFVLLVFLSLSFFIRSAYADGLMVYTTRKVALIKPLFSAYASKTGTAVDYVTGEPDWMLRKLAGERAEPKADLFISIDAGSLWLAAEMGLLEPVESETLNKNVPEPYRDQEGRWYGLSLSARTIVFNPRRTSSSELATYEALAGPGWKGRLCLTSSGDVYNQSLMAMMIAQYGADKAESMVRGWVSNLASGPLRADEKLLLAIAAGKCDVGIASTNFYGKMIKKDTFAPIKLFWADQGAGGTHIDVSGAGVVAGSKNRDEALRFIEWLTSKDAQGFFADVNMEYPVNPMVRPNSAVASWGAFGKSRTSVAEYGRLREQAVDIMKRSGYE